MIRLSTILSDLEKEYYGYKFINKKSINKILLSFFELKFNLFLIEQENEIDLLKRYNNTIAFINRYTIAPEKKYIITIKDIVGFTYKFIEDFKDDIFDAIPNSLKKEVNKDLMTYNDESIEIQNQFFFCKTFMSINEYKETNFDFLLKAFELKKEDIPKRFLHIFDLNCLEEELEDFSVVLNTLSNTFFYKRNYYFDNVYLSYKFTYYIIIIFLCFNKVSKFFIRDKNYAIPSIERNTKEIREFYINKNKLKEEIVRRNNEVKITDKEHLIKHCQNLVKNDKIFNEMLDLFLYLKSTLKHL